MIDLKIVSIGPETIAGYNGPSWPKKHGIDIHSACVAIAYPDGDIVALDVMDKNDKIVIERGAEDFKRPSASAADAIAHKIALTAQLVIRGDKYRIFSPSTVLDGGYQLP